MNQQHTSEQLRAEAEARRSATEGSTSSWDRVQAALRRYLTTEGYRAAREQGHEQGPEPGPEQGPGGSSSTRHDLGEGRSPR